MKVTPETPLNQINQILLQLMTSLLS